MTDALGQSATQSFTGKIGTVCAASSFTTTNGRNESKKVDRDDVIAYGFTTPIDTRSIIPYWTSGGVGVTVFIPTRARRRTDDPQPVDRTGDAARHRPS